MKNEGPQPSAVAQVKTDRSDTAKVPPSLESSAIFAEWQRLTLPTAPTLSMPKTSIARLRL